MVDPDTPSDILKMSTIFLSERRSFPESQNLTKNVRLIEVIDFLKSAWLLEKDEWLTCGTRLSPVPKLGSL